MRFDPKQRATARELMDVEDSSFVDLHECLRDLAVVNRVTLGYRPTLGFLDRMKREGRLPVGRPLHVVDIGCGYGDTLRRISRWAARRQISVRLTGVDLNPKAIRAAQNASRRHPAIRWIQKDVFACVEWPDGEPDFLISSLFAHHLNDDEHLSFIRWMEATALSGWFINDLLRHPVSYWGFMVLARAAGWHRFVVHDGPLSIARAFQQSDWTNVIAAAGIGQAGVRLESWFPYRLCVSRVKSH